ncbi:MAG TPA: septal ring lytic transglycosylase RlpA family protein [Anaeromyxobacteraceae bacterium]|nr:septal ring lytic transglycosylase RlpA family protein [Anaeromyxobacteraceae bacterium]
MRGVGARRAAAALALALAAGCAHAPVPGDEAGGEVGLASVYADRLQGHRTASGAPYDREAFTCAHRTLPFGAQVEVTALDSGRRVVVTVTDRGPHVAGRVVDLSLAAARALGVGGRGLLRVRVERVR